MNEKYVCVDFDGTIVDHRFPDIGPEVPLAFYWLKIFQESDIKIILFTMRSNCQSDGDVLDDAVKFIKIRGIDLFGINTNPNQSSWTTSPKAYGQIYIDDAAVGCPLIKIDNFMRPCVDWLIVGPMVMRSFNL